MLKLYTCDDTRIPMQATFHSLGHKNVLVNSRLELGPVQLKDGDLIEVLLTILHCIFSC